MRSIGLMLQFRKYGGGLIAVWTCILAAFVLFIVDEYREDTIKESTREARDYHNLNLHYRRWSSKIGGVYVSADKVLPNPYLVVPDRDVITESGKSLTLVNPAYMTRMVFETIQKESKNPIINRLVSLKPLNPANTPNEWELETLRLFENSGDRERSQILMINELPYLQFMGAFITEEGCLKCHAHQGYKIGDVRGGMSVAIPISEYLAIEKERTHMLFGGVALLWVLGSAGIAVSESRRHGQERKIIEKTVALEAEILERQRTQEQLEEQAGLLEEEVAERLKDEDELKNKNAELERFMYTLSHDLTTPLVSITYFLGSLEESIKSVETIKNRADIDYIRSAAAKMKLLLEELLELSRVGRVVATREPVRHQDIITEVLSLCAGQIQERHIRVSVDECSLVLIGDRIRLVEIWQNLVENAAKYSGDQPEPHIRIGVEQSSGDTVFFVRDNGIGIDGKFHENIFGLFNKLDAASEGSGLGLALVRRIVEMYGGRIWVESDGIGTGSCFRFTLPEALEQT